MEKTGKKIKKTESQIRSLHIKLMVIFAAIIMAASLTVSIFVLEKAGNTMESKLASLTGAHNRQQRINVDSYLDKVENTVALFFSDDIYCQYDETKDDIDKFDKIQKENAILARIQDLGVLENFSDFGIIYSDDNAIGWISNNVQELYPEGGLYAALDKNISDDARKAGWFAGFGGNYDRLYYVKQINSNAILLASFYTRELFSLFECSDLMDHMESRLVDASGLVLYSSLNKEIGKALDKRIKNNADFKQNDVVVTDKYLISTDSCENNWIVVTTIPREVLVGEVKSLKLYAFAFTSIILLCALLFGNILLKRIINPVGGMVKSLAKRADYDQLTGILNKASFEERVKEIIGESTKEDIHVLVMMDMDNFKMVNDEFGHIAGDKVLTKFAELIRRICKTDTMWCGRMGGDEFAVYRCYKGFSMEDATKETEKNTKLFFDAFEKKFESEKSKCDLSVSAGVYLADFENAEFEKMYIKADEALYTSKHNGKNMYSIHNNILK